jgi:hypothetical protein
MIQNVPIDQIKFHRWHKELPGDARAAITVLYHRIGNVLGKTLDEWIDGFCFDLRYRREIGIWTLIAEAWELFKHRHPAIAKNNPRELAALLAACTCGSIDGKRCAKKLQACWKETVERKAS